MPRTNRQVLLRRRPEGLVVPDDTELVSSPAPEPADGEALVRITYVGVDAAARTWLDDAPGYLPPVQLGEVVRAAGIGEVVESRCDAYAVGDVVTMLAGFQEYTIVRDDVFCTPVTGMDVIDHPAVLSVYGPTGATAYFGMNDVGRPQAGEHRRGLRGGGRDRFDRGPDRQDRRRPRGRHRRRAGEVPRGRRGLRLRRVHRLPRGRPGRRAEAALPARRRRLLRQRRRRDPGRRARAGWP